MATAKLKFRSNQSTSIARSELRIGWFSTWNSRCGIAEYSKYLLNEFDSTRFDWRILASRNDIPIAADDERVMRCWTNHEGSALELLEVVRAECFDVLVVQFKLQVGFDFLSLHHLEALIACCHCVNTRVIVILHATTGADPALETIPLPRIAAALSTVERVLVHSHIDLDRLRAFGIDGTAELLPHGFVHLAPAEQDAFRQVYHLPLDSVIIGSHGFLLPHKGIGELIKAFALLRRSGTKAALLLVNALYPIAASEEYLAFCQGLAAEHGVSDDVIFETQFLSPDISLQLLAACDVIVFPYQATNESSSAAVRFGLSSGRPVLCSPLAIFSDVAPVVHFLGGTHAEDIYADLVSFFADERRGELATIQSQWVEQNSWPRVAASLMAQFTAQSSPQQQKARRTWLAHYVSELHIAHEAVNTTTSVPEASCADAELAVARIAALEQQCVRLEKTIEVSAADLRTVYASTSWRITGPLRKLRRLSRSWHRLMQR